MDYDIDTAKAWLEKMEQYDEPLLLVLTSHLYVEYRLDYLLAMSVPNYSAFKTRSFAIKADTVYALGLIPEMLYENIRKLNRIRNAYAHKIDVDFLSLALDFYDPNNAVTIQEFKNAPEKIQDCLRWIGVVTFGWLHNQIVARTRGGKLTLESTT